MWPFQIRINTFVNFNFKFNKYIFGKIFFLRCKRYCKSNFNCDISLITNFTFMIFKLLKNNVLSVSLDRALVTILVAGESLTTSTISLLVVEPAISRRPQTQQMRAVMVKENT